MKCLGGTEAKPWTRKPPARSRNGTETGISNCEPRSAVVCGITPIRHRSASSKGMLRTRAGRTFAAMPKSTSQTSPRFGLGAGIGGFLDVQARKRLCGYGAEIIVSPVIQAGLGGHSHHGKKFRPLLWGETDEFFQEVGNCLRHNPSVIYRTSLGKRVLNRAPRASSSAHLSTARRRRYPSPRRS